MIVVGVGRAKVVVAVGGGGSLCYAIALMVVVVVDVVSWQESLGFNMIAEKTKRKTHRDLLEKDAPRSIVDGLETEA